LLLARREQDKLTVLSGVKFTADQS